MSSNIVTLSPKPTAHAAYDASRSLCETAGIEQRTAELTTSLDVGYIEMMKRR